MLNWRSQTVFQKRRQVLFGLVTSVALLSFFAIASGGATTFVVALGVGLVVTVPVLANAVRVGLNLISCLLYTSDAADE